MELYNLPFVADNFLQEMDFSNLTQKSLDQKKRQRMD